MTPTWEMHEMDCRLAMGMLMDADSVDSIVTDPPYGLSKEPDMAEVLQHWLAGDDYTHGGSGFMGKSWDSFVPGPSVWREAYRVLKPGGHLVAFFGTRTYDLGVLALRLAGFEIRDQLAWVFGSGFPKSHDVSKGIDKLAGAERPKTPTVAMLKKGEVGEISKNVRCGECGKARASGNPCVCPRLEDDPITDDARKWQGWGTALKPAYEPIVLARKPLASLDTNVLQMVETQLRQQGVTGDISWIPENAKDAVSKNYPKTSLSTARPQAAGMSAGNVGASGIGKTEKTTPPPSDALRQNGGLIDGNTSASTLVNGPSNCEKTFSEPTANNASAAGSGKNAFSRSTISEGADRLTDEKSIERFMNSLNETDSPKGIGFSVGIVTGPIGSMENVRILQNDDGRFIWPAGLPKFIPSKPITVARNVLTHGTGALNIDGCRVGTEGGTKAVNHVKKADGRLERWDEQFAGARNEIESIGKGRWPANLAHDGSPEVLAEFPVTKSGVAVRSKSGGLNCHSDTKKPIMADLGYDDGGGSAARFFYCAKASKSDRNEGLDDLPEQPSAASEFRPNHTEGAAAGEDGNPYGRWSPVRNAHPTVKPTALMQWLVRLVTPPGGIVLDPFTGSGSTGKAAMLEGFSFVGCEMDPDYAKIARLRIDHAVNSR